MRKTIRLFLLLEGVSFLIAAAIHSGLMTTVDRNQGATIAESTIGVVLLIGYGLSWLWSAQTLIFGIVAQTFALLGTLIGVYVVLIGVGPNTIPDIIYHFAILAVLVWGLVIVARAPTEAVSSALR